jgi:putative ABC transport system substrate-binding protein
MKRRVFVAAIGAMLASPASVVAQQTSRVYRVGLLTPGQVAIVAEKGTYGAPLIRSLAARGYIVDRNLVFERRAAEAQMDQLPRLLDELAASKVDVIVTVGYPTTLAAKRRTALPVIAFNAGDPVGTGLVANLARPGANMTGISDVSAELTPKRLDLLRQVTPRLRRVAMLWNINDLSMTLRYEASEAGARAIGIGVQPFPLRTSADFDLAFASMTREMPDAILLVSDSLTHANRKRVFEFAAAQRLPVMYEADWIVRDGGLMSYGPDLEESLDRVAYLVDRILKGAKPADLPFEQPRRFRLAINLKAAKALGLTVPQTVLTAADEVIE